MTGALQTESDDFLIPKIMLQILMVHRVAKSDLNSTEAYFATKN